ncbi:hypothetical protein PPOLYM_01789 [Paenibacillus polymyxa]|uniref:DUF1177 domain-containing protein n=1 Tax=Paenibacillus peoriae TaxID=59893 RepID=A0ABU1QBT7_9BACL|nr:MULTISPECIES: DUF1177 domain-containing protein [Paenibacillus]APQ60557.1 hypothetical protein VK72_18435 [Paenibacillus polymyxa]MDR6777077.1 hypothetical protein [Paenibacillus peoriae]VUG05409.1 hypothetical protein PPOLYM_01789 [Paenibacillus polymyxa]
MMKQVFEVYDLLDSPFASGAEVKAYLEQLGQAEITVSTVKGEKGSTDFIKIVIAGKTGRIQGGDSPTLGVVGRLGGLGARPEMIGFVSDGDGAAAAISAAAKLLSMQSKGDVLDGDVILCTHICPDAPTQPHDPVPFMDSPVDILTMNKYEVTPEMEAILSIDTTKGNRVINHKGIAISPTVRQGYVLRISEDLVDIVQTVTGEPCVTFAVTTQDITPYGNDLYHINSILQPAVATSAPVVGVAITAAAPVPGSATGASHESDIALAAKLAVETAKAYGRGQCSFHSEKEFQHITKLYGTMKHLQTMGKSE